MSTIVECVSHIVIEAYSVSHICMCVCVYVCMCVCTYVCMYVCMYVCVYVRMCLGDVEVHTV